MDKLHDLEHLTKRKTRHKPFTVDINEDVLARLDKLTAKLDCSRIALVRVAIDQFLEKYQDE